MARTRAKRYNVVSSRGIVRKFKYDDPVRFIIPPDVWRNGMLVRMPNHLGDAIMALPALVMLKKTLPPYCGLMVAAPAEHHQMYAAMTDLVDRIFDIPAQHHFWPIGLMHDIRSARPGIAIMFNSSIKDAFSLWLLRIPRVFGFSNRGSKAFLDCFLYPPGKDSHEHVMSHETNIFMALAMAAGAKKWNGDMPEMRTIVPVEDMPDKIRELCSHPKLMIIAPGSGYGTAKRYPTANYATIARYWLRRGGLVTVVGNRSEHGIGNDIIESLPPDRAFNLCGDTDDMAQLIEIIRYSRIVIANDSGVMHLAAAIGVRGIAFFGPSDYTYSAPISTKWKIFYSKCKCSPCFAKTCRHDDDFCLSHITPYSVIREVRKMDSIGGSQYERQR